MLWRHEGGGGEGHGAGCGDRWQATTMNAVDRGGATAVAASTGHFLHHFCGVFMVVSVLF